MTVEEIKAEIERLKKEKNAVILAHFYARPEVQDIADFLGDSLQLSRQAASTNADIIVFCGVHFMAETAAILSPEKKVLSPTPHAGCSLAEGMSVEGIRKWKEQHPGGIVVSYVNTTAAVKAESDYCFTSSNVLDVVAKLPKDKDILIGPDRNLGAYVLEKTKRKMDLWNSDCFVHNRIDAKSLLQMAERYPEADVLIHPECSGATSREVIDHPRCYMYSTAGILKHAKQSPKKQFVIATEPGVMHLLKKQNPTKEFIAVQPESVCYHMKEAGLWEVLETLRDEKYQITVDSATREKALIPLQRMLG
ncbi:MAG: quinolinate synthase NadA [Prevotella sp.]|jgi:quinolinate synthase